jgi:glycerol-3-phosphate acyltransferase PlsY
VHRSVHAAAIVTGACWVGAYVAGSVPFAYLVERSRLRRDLRRVGPDDLRTLLTGRFADPALAPPTPAELAGALLDIAKVIGLAAVSLLLVRAVSPGVHRGEVPAASAFGFLADQVLTFWQSAALWAGLAAAAAHMHPVWPRPRRASPGQAPLLALAVWFTPVGFVVAVAVFLAGFGLSRDQRVGVAFSLAGFVAATWATWLWPLGHWWGLPPGPEVAIWSAMMAGLVALSPSTPRSGSPSSGTPAPPP